MNKLTKTLLGSAALCALATPPAVAENHPAFYFSPLYGDRVVNKTTIRNQSRTHLTYTYGSVSTYVPASDLDKTVPLARTFWKFNSNDTICSSPKTKVRVVPKKTQYAKISAATVTVSGSCESGPTVFYGAAYELTNPAGEGQIDHFVSSVIGKFQNSGVKYRGTLNVDMNVNIGE